MNHFKLNSGKILFAFSIALFSSMSMYAQEKSTYKVAIFLYENVELLDFAGPTEVFAATPGFKVYTVSVDGKDILSQGLLTVKPQYSIDNAPVPDIIVFPGGAADPSSRNPKVIKWAQGSSAAGSTLMSVCTGAFILARANMLDNLEATTHWGSTAALQQTVPSAKVLEKTRFVDNGKVITTAGVSAGIDGALHLVARIKGVDVANATAHYMEYENWTTEKGKMAFTNPYFEEQGKITTETPIPYEGEIIDVSKKMYEDGHYKSSAQLLEKAVKWYPNSGAMYNAMSLTYSKMGKPVPMSETEFIKILDAGNFEEAMKVVDKTQREYPGWKIFTEYAMLVKGYDLIRKENYPDAIKVFQLHTRVYPDSWNAWDSLAEANMNAGNKKEAIIQYKKSLALDPTNTNAVNMLEKLEGMK